MMPDLPKSAVNPRWSDTQRKRTRARGYSLVETLVVVGVVLVLTAVAVPIVHQGLQTYKLGSAATDVANLIQRTRYEAIRQNTTISCRYQQQGNNWVMWIDLNGDGNMAPTEPQILLPSYAQVLGPGVAPGVASMGPAYANATSPPQTGNTYVITLDSRGTVNPPAVYVIYLGSQQTASTNGYKAITLTPTGRTKMWNASAYGSWYTN